MTICRDFFYALSGNDFARELVDTETNEQLKGTLGVSSITKISLLFLLRSLNLTRRFQEKALKNFTECRGWHYKSCLKWPQTWIVKKVDSSYPPVVVPNKKNRNTLVQLTLDISNNRYLERFGISNECLGLFENN